MPTATFYTHVSDPAAFACRLVRRAAQNPEPLLVWTQELGELESLDQALWRDPPEGFLPHEIWQTDAAFPQGVPVVLACGAQLPPLPAGTVVLNLSQDFWTQAAPPPLRVLEIVGSSLEELAAARERKQFLDAQSHDLTEAMNTLEDAIRKIDQETRELLGHTFHTVNEHFGRMFPELFGGGQARLVMTGDEILDAGVQVMAQPPGKKNQTIHLLSGGEKALTAIALVFAIFQLNPAPFCLLDEVDAPLDDANTERYARLVTAMSGQGTQFLFISHNKIAMEMAEQLIGVTMQEQGVSRIVAVDMESAIRMAQ